jgi:hypothetical protein
MMPIQGTPRPVVVRSSETAGQVIPLPLTGGEQASKALREQRIERGWSLMDVARATLSSRRHGRLMPARSLARRVGCWCRCSR